MLFKKKLFLFFISNLFLILFFGKPAKAATENDFSLNIHGFYNFGGNIFKDIRTEGFWQYIDGKICELNGFSSLAECQGKANGTEIIRLSGQTGIIAKKIDDSKCQSGDSSPCFDASLNPPRTWASIDGAVKHATSLGMEIIMELNLLEKSTTAASPQIPIPYIRDKADVDHLLALGEKAIKRYDGDCDINEDGDCTDFVEDTQESPSIVYPKIKYWQVGNEPGNNKWTFNEKTIVNGREVLLLAYATNEFAKKLKTYCPDCKIVLAGVGGDNRPDYYYRFIYDTVPFPGDCTGNNCSNVRGYYRKLIQDLKFIREQSSGPANFDIFDFHHHHQQPIEYTSWKNIKDKYDVIKKLLTEEGFPTLPIWITETSSWTGTPSREQWSSVDYPNHTEEDQAGELVKRFVYAYSLGIKKVFWSPMIIDSPYGNNATGYFSNVGLLKSDGTPKISFNTFKIMISKMKNFQTVEKIDVGNQDAYLFKFNFSGKAPFLVFWKENGDNQISLFGRLNPYLAVTVTDLQGRETGETIFNISGKSTPKFIEPFPCPKGNQGDLDCNNQVDNNDINIIKDIWAPYGNIINIIISASNKPKYLPDLNNDNLVNEKDLAFILKNFGK